MVTSDSTQQCHMGTEIEDYNINLLKCYALIYSEFANNGKIL